MASGRRERRGLQKRTPGTDARRSGAMPAYVGKEGGGEAASPVAGGRAAFAVVEDEVVVDLVPLGC